MNKKKWIKIILWIIVIIGIVPFDISGDKYNDEFYKYDAVLWSITGFEGERKWSLNIPGCCMPLWQQLGRYFHIEIGLHYQRFPRIGWSNKNGRWNIYPGSEIDFEKYAE